MYTPCAEGFCRPVFGSFEIVGEATNGRDAVESAAELDPDVILMDIRMPLLDGIQATRLIKQELGLRATVVTFTTYSWNEIRQDAYHAGASFHVRKPFDLETLIDPSRMPLNLSGAFGRRRPRLMAKSRTLRWQKAIRES